MAGEYGYLHQARVLNYDAARNAYDLQSVSLAQGSRWPNVPSCRPGLITGDRVVVAALGTSRDNLVILGKVGEDFPDIGDIPGLMDALNTLTATDTALDGRLDTAESTLTSHTGSIATNTANIATNIANIATNTANIATNTSGVATNAANLASHVADIDAHNGLRRVANLTTRNALTSNYDGRVIYRQDRDWIEVYDGTGAWRVQGSAVCANTADLTAITNPNEGQTAYQTDTKAYYQYSGGGWRPVTGYGGRWTQDNAQSISNGTDTKVTWNNQLDTPIGISQGTSGGLPTGIFTITQPGKWDLAATLVYPWTASLEMWFWIGPSTGTTTRWELSTRTAGSTLGPPQPLRTGIKRTFAINDTFALWTWHSSATPKLLDNTFGGMIHFEATWVGPA